MIVSKDSDFGQAAFLYGAPPLLDNDTWPPEIDILEVVGRKPGDSNVGLQGGPPPGQLLRQVPAYFLITPEIGGNWPGPTSSQTVWPMSMDVDHVRIYSR